MSDQDPDDLDEPVDEALAAEIMAARPTMNRGDMLTTENLRRKLFPSRYGGPTYRGMTV